MSALPIDESAAVRESPFLLLDYYRQSDAYRFAGREEEIGAVVTGVLTFDTFVLYGRSGLGKSSLLLAGVFPELVKRGYRPIHIRVLDLRLDELRAKLEGSIAGDTPVVLTLDQFEEFFIRVREEHANHAERRQAACREFAAMLASIVAESRGRVRLLFGIREDYYAELEDFRAEIPGIGSHGFRLLPLTAYGARRAIMLPLEHAKISYDQKLLNKLVDEVARSGFDPLLLQIICTEVWREANRVRPDTNELTTGDFDRVGGFEEIFDSYVRRAAEGPPERQLVVRVVLDTLITAEQTKRAMGLNELIQEGSGRLYIRAERSEVEAVLQQLGSCQLVRVIGDGNQKRFELLHDRLAPVVQRWLSSDKTFVDFRFAKTFVSNFVTIAQVRGGSGYLISEEQMREMIGPWKERLRLTPEETDLLFRSSVHAQLETPFWASRVDEIRGGRSTATIESMLESENPTVREGAATAVRELVAGPAFARRLLRMALEDPILEVRNAAGRSFAVVASEEDLELLAAHTNDLLLSERASAVVVECYEQHRSTHRFPWSIRRRAWVAVRKRAAKADGERIRDAMARGAIRGSIMGALWTLTVWIGLTEMAMWNTASDLYVDEYSDERVAFSAVSVLLGAAVGAGLGCLSARRVARRRAVARWEAAYGGPTRGIFQAALMWFLTGVAWAATPALGPNFILHEVRLSTLVVLASIVALVPLLSVLARQPVDRGRRGGRWLWLHRTWPWLAMSVIVAWFAVQPTFSADPLVVALIVIASTFVAQAVLALQKSCRSDSRPLGAFWTLASASGPALIGILLIAWLYERLGNEQIALPATLSALALALGCFRGAVIGYALDGVPVSPPKLRRWPRFAARVVLMSCLIVALPFYGSLFGYESIPWWDQPSSESHRILRGKLLQNVPNVHYHRFEASATAPRLYEGVSRYLRSDSGIEDRGEQATFKSIGLADAPFTLPIAPRNTSAAGDYRLRVQTHAVKPMVIEGGLEVVVIDVQRQGNQWWPQTPTATLLFAPAVIRRPDSNDKATIHDSELQTIDLTNGRTSRVFFARTSSRTIWIEGPFTVIAPKHWTGKEDRLTIIGVKAPPETAGDVDAPAVRSP